MSLQDNARRWREVMRTGVCGPLIIAHEVIALRDSWAQYQSQADGTSFTSWCVATFGSTGKGAEFFARRARAVDVLGEACRRRLHHDVAVWLAQKQLTKQQRATALKALYSACSSNGNNPLNKQQADRLVQQVLKLRRPESPRCSECGQVIKHRSGVVDDPIAAE